jgi:hypothetical protein
MCFSTNAACCVSEEGLHWPLYDTGQTIYIGIILNCFCFQKYLCLRPIA